MNSFADKIIEFNKSLDFNGELPKGINIMNPFRRDDYILLVSSSFYKKFYDDNKPRHLILGINPGRFGAGVTGIPFTDTKRLTNECGLKYSGKETHEPSSVFVYEVIKAYGGLTKFYNDFYISAVCPLGFTISDAKGKEKNYNYYDSTELTNTLFEFIVENIKNQIAFGIETNVCFCFGTGKNEKFLRLLNDRYGFFKKLVPLEHPRFIMQYKSKSRQEYVDKYINAFKSS
ncbi:MAG: DUF4918 family protein [Bacteroidales bacterium]|nr:DUF4918 family protein [Bacteroidales bacterium]